MAKIHLPYIVFLTRSQGHRIPPEGLTYLELPPPKVHDATGLYFAYLIRWAILNQGQRLGKNPLTHLVVVRRHVEAQGLVRTFKIVEVAPLVEAFLRSTQVVEAFIAQDLGLERAMETLVFALGLRMMRTTVAQTHAESQKPYFEFRPVALGSVRGSTLFSAPVTSRDSIISAIRYRPSALYSGTGPREIPYSTISSTVGVDMPRSSIS